MTYQSIQLMETKRIKKDEKINSLFLAISIIIGIASGIFSIYILYVNSINDIIAIAKIKQGLVILLNVFSIIFGWMTETLNRLFFYFPPLIITFALVFWVYGIFIASKLLLNEKEMHPRVVKITKVFRTSLWLFVNVFIFYRFILLIYSFYNLGFSFTIIREQLIPILTLVLLGVLWLILKVSNHVILRYIIGYPGLLFYILVLIILYETIWLNELLVAIYPSDRYDFLAGCIVVFGGYNIPFYLIRIYNSIKLET